MSITNITPQELKLQAEVFNLTGELSAVRSFLLQERLEVRQLKAKSEMDYAMLAGVNALIAGLKREVAELKAKLAEAEKRLHMLLMPVPAKNVTALEVCKVVSEQAMEIIQLLKGTP